MRFLGSIVLSVLSLSANAAFASSWSFEDATISVQSKGTGVGGGFKEKLSPSSPLSQAVTLGPTDTLKLILTTTDGKTAKRAHQAFLTLQESKTGLEESFPFSIKENGKGKVEVTQKDLPFQFQASESPLTASLVIASFGLSDGYKSKAFSLTVERDPNVPISILAAPVRYGSLSEIHHIFKDGPKSPNVVISTVFALAVVATLPVLFGVWSAIGANFGHLSKAMNSAPIPHVLFVGSIVALEGIFFMYYTSWNLFQTLPAAGLVGAVAFVSGSRALSEVQERRLAGLR